MEELTADTASASPVAASFYSLKSYLLANGTKDSSGNLLVSHVDSNGIIYGFCYNESLREFYFVMVYETSSGNDSVEDDMVLTIKEDDLKKGNIACSVTYSSGIYADLSTSAYLSNINKSSQLL